MDDIELDNFDNRPEEVPEEQQEEANIDTAGEIKVLLLSLGLIIVNIWEGLEGR